MYPSYKIKEARYFLNELRGLKIASEEFCFNFSALLSATRSATFAMQSLYAHKEGYEEEYGKFQEKLKSLPFAREMLLARNISEKQGHKVPILITTLINLDTNDKLTYECDPLPHDANDVIRRVSFEYGDDKEGWIPADLPGEKRDDLYMAQLSNAIKRMTESSNTETTYGIKLLENGKYTTVEIFYDDTESLLTTLEETANSFELRWPSSSLFAGLIKARIAGEEAR
ncbi:MAG: hypothetical protein PHF56_22520 [Desulfuromonadaceae bacterium]|nr:hypothetical protein [Desulfuromonadaceae bacterium]